MSENAVFPIRSSAFWYPESYQASAWIEHVPFAFWLIDVLRPTRFVELGTYHGMSYLTFCQAIKALNLKTSATAIDTWNGDDHTGRLSSNVFGALKDIHDIRYGSFSTLMQSTFNEAVSAFEDESIDLLHIDGFHTYQAVKNDFETWLAKVSRSKASIILFHDTQERGRDFGVYRLWAELIENYPNFEFHHGHGLGVLGVGPDLPQELLALFISTKSGDAYIIRDAFESLGQRIRKAQINTAYANRTLAKSYYQTRRIAGRALKRMGVRIK